jgi:hypothetical protein
LMSRATAWSMTQGPAMIFRLGDIGIASGVVVVGQAPFSLGLVCLAQRGALALRAAMTAVQTFSFLAKRRFTAALKRI